MDGGKALIKMVEDFLPYNEQEEKDRELMLHYLYSGENLFLRENPGAHMSASA